MTQNYKLKLTGPGFNVEREITEALAQQIVVLSLGGAIGAESRLPPHALAEECPHRDRKTAAEVRLTAYRIRPSRSPLILRPASLRMPRFAAAPTSMVSRGISRVPPIAAGRTTRLPSRV